MINHPLFYVFSRMKTGGKRNNEKWIITALPFTFLLFFRFFTDVCPCTIFTLAAFLQLFLVIILTGHGATLSIASEREKKTLDALRLTSINTAGIVLGKLIPDFMELGKIIAVTSPFVLLAGWTFGGAGFFSPLFAITISIMAGLIVIFGLSCLSAYSVNSSQAIVISWVLRGVLVLITPLLDNLFASILLLKNGIPLLSNLNPAVPLLYLIMPEALAGTNWTWTPYLFPFIVPLFCVACVILSSGAIESNEKNSYTRRGKTLEFFKNDIFNKISFFKNPIFLKEMVTFRTDVLGLLPGILVFLVLWLAPCFYCISDVSVFGRSHLHLRDRQLTVLPDTQVPSPSGQGNQSRGNVVAVTNNRGETFILENHKKDLCLRMLLYESIAIPLPVDGYYSYENQPYIQRQEFSQNRQVDNNPVNSGHGVYNYHQNNYNHNRNTPELPVTLGLTHDALVIGFYISSVIILIYLVIRCSGFLCSTYQTEKNKLTWDVLRLTGLSNEDIVMGKLLGVLFLPLLQMSLAFLVLFVWIIEGAVTFSGAFYFYIFCIAVSMVAGLLGQYNSIKYKTAHESQGHTIATVLIYGFLLSVISTFIFGCRAFRSYDIYGGSYHNMDGGIKIAGLLVCAASIVFCIILHSIPSVKRHGSLVFAFGLLFFIETMAGYVSYIPFLNPLRNKSLVFGNLYMEKGGSLPLISGDTFVFALSLLCLYLIGRWLWDGIIEQLKRDA